MCHAPRVPHWLALEATWQSEDQGACDASRAPRSHIESPQLSQLLGVVCLCAAENVSRSLPSRLTRLKQPVKVFQSC